MNTTVIAEIAGLSLGAMLHHFPSKVDIVRADVEPLHHARLGQVGLRHEEAGASGGPRRDGHGEDAADGTEVSLEAHLAQVRAIGQCIAGELAAGDQDPERDRQVEGRSVLPDRDRS